MTKRTLLSIILLGFIALMSAQAQDLFISEYVEGSSNNKAIEIFNGTGAPVDLANYTMRLASNGGTWSTTNSVTLSGTLANNDVFVIANSQAMGAILDVADLTHTVTYFNGNDCLGLFNGTTLIDIIGVYQTDPGTAWDVAGVTNATLNHTLVRKPHIVQGNLDWIAGAGTNADNSEWIVHPQDYVADLGMHTFQPGGGDNAATPTFDPPAGVYAQPVNVAISTTTPDATIRYTTNGSDPTETSTLYTGPVAISSTTTLKARAWAAGMDPSYVATAIYTFPVVVSNLAALRAANADGTTVYHLANEVVLTFQQNFRHQKYVQDYGAAILIDDYPGIITTQYQIGDGISGLTGTLSRYTTGMLQFWPTMDPGPATSTANTIITPTVTINEIVSNLEFYQSRL
ncbi:MAG: chitobiase/beta-hexosaminidase C-terminal domain-containing protein, partial [Candidatus Syntrophosphaera sp.]|nr:chitobiase/beta-hexosaminidase C-terminal domain-containing protein [Candidatus Syntrophosphaera sp.]